MEHLENYLNPGTELAGYRVQSLIARGGMGVVYLALDIQLSRPVALKLLAPELSRNEKFRQRFVRESRLAASVDHPNILPVYGAGEWSGLLYIAMRYVRGTDLKAELDARGRLPLNDALRILSDTAAALDAAHAAGLVHRDVKPGNILLSDDRADGHRHVYLTDFGLTKRAASATGVTTAGHFLGTLDYVAPEQIRGEDVDGRADVYALACVAYTLLASHPPFDHDDDSAQLWAHMFEEPPRLSDESLDVPSTVELAILAGMAKQREDRPPSCGALVAMMYGDEPVDAGPAPPPDDGNAATDQESDDGSLTEVVSRAGSDHAARSFRRFSQRSGVPQQGRTRWPVRGVWLVGIGVALVLLVGAGLLLPRMLAGEERVTFSAEGIPYTLNVPESWNPRTAGTGGNTVSVLSDADLTALFTDQLEGPVAAARAASDPARVVGLAIYHRPPGVSAESPSAALVGTAEAILPGTDPRLGGLRETSIGEVNGHTMEGTLSVSPDVTLQVRVLVAETDPVQLLVFFAPTSLFGERTQIFDEVAASLRLTE